MKRLTKITALITTTLLLLTVSTFPFPKEVEANWFSGSYTERADVGYTIKNDNYTTNIKVVVTRRLGSIRVEQTVQICQGNGSESVCSVKTYPEHYFDNAKFTFNFFEGTASLTIPQTSPSARRYICRIDSCYPELVPLTQLFWKANGAIQKTGGKTGAGGFMRLWRTANVTGQVEGFKVPENVEGTLSIQHDYISYSIVPAQRPSDSSVGSF